MVSGYFAYQLQTNKAVDGLVADRQKGKFLWLGSSRWPNNQHILNCNTGHKNADTFNMHNTYLKDCFDKVNICKNIVKSLYKEISV
jgi:hypothetical protein